MNCRVLSLTSVYECLKGKFKVQEKITFKDCQCNSFLNNSMLVDALIVAGFKHLHHRITENIMLSYCPLMSKHKKDGENESAEMSDNVIPD